MKTKIKTVDSVLSERILIDTETGEELACKTVVKTIQTDTDFYKIWVLDALGILKIVGGQKMCVVNHIFENMIPSKNMFLGSMREISEATGISTVTVNKTIMILVDKGFLRKVRNSCYMVNPDIIAKGNSKKRQALLVLYNQLPNGSKDPEAEQDQDE